MYIFSQNLAHKELQIKTHGASEGLYIEHVLHMLRHVFLLVLVTIVHALGITQLAKAC